MIDIRIAIIFLGSIGALIGLAGVVALFFGWLTGITVGTIFTEIVRFLYKIWDTILSFFQTMVHAAPGVIKIIIFTALFWVIGNFLISSTVGATHACSEDGKLYDLSFTDGIGYAFLPDDFNTLYYIQATNDAYTSYTTGGTIFGIGKKTTYLNATANLVQPGEWFITPKNMAQGTRDLLGKWFYGTTQADWQSITGTPAFTNQGPGSYKDYPMKEFSICRKVDQKLPLVGAEQQIGECVFWEGTCDSLQEAGKNTLAYASFATVWKMKYAVRYYQGANARQLRYMFVNTGECSSGSKITKLPFGGEIVWTCDTSVDAIDLTRCKTNDDFKGNFTYTSIFGSQQITIGGGLAGSSETTTVSIDGSNPDDYYDLHVVIYNETLGGPSLIKNTTGRIYGTQKTPLRGAESDSGGFFGTSVVRTLFKSDNRETLVESKESFLMGRNSTIPDKKKLIYFDCMQGNNKKYNSEMFLARLPIFSMKFILMLVAFTLLFAAISFINNFKRSR